MRSLVKTATNAYCAIVALLLLAMATTANAQEQKMKWFAGADFWTYFDNKENSPCEIDYSRTLFGVHLMPYGGIRWANSSRVTFGVDMRQDFGDDVTFLSDAKPVIYYSYKGDNWKVLTGVFPRKELRGDYSEAIFNPGFYYTDNLVPGVATSYKSEKGLWEVALSWDGMYCMTRREKFKLFSSGRYFIVPHFYVGYEAAMTHLARSAKRPLDEGVVEHTYVGPYIGTRFNAFFDFDVRARLLYSFQKDRIVNNSKNPLGGQVDVSVAKWGFRLHNETYFGKSQTPFFKKYGTLFYSTNEMYGTRHNIYNHSELDYTHNFFDGILEVEAGFEAHYDGVGVGLQQKLSVRVNIEKIF